MKSNKIKLNLIFLATLIVLGCGVKGDPLPPERTTNIGKAKVNEIPAEKELEKNENKKSTTKAKGL